MVAGVSGLCNSDKSKEAVSNIQAVRIRWTQCLKFEHSMKLKFLPSQSFFSLSKQTDEKEKKKEKAKQI